MAKRVAAGFLWAFTIYSGWQLVTGVVTGSASLGTIGLIIGLVGGIVIAIDPWNKFWQPRARRVFSLREPRDFDAERATGPRG